MISKFRRRLLINAARKNNNITYPGLIAAWSAAGKSNDDADRAVLRDLTGNGHDITLKGFAFNTEGSGYGHPEYPDALVFDGVADYGINEDMPTLTDYTIIAEREFLYPSNTAVKDFVFISYTKRLNYHRSGDLFSLESRYGNYYAITFATQTFIHVNNNRSIVYQNKNNYNGKDILCNEMSSEGFNTLRFGRIINNYTPMAFYSAYLFDRSLNEQEIKAFIRKYIDADYLLPSEIPTPDCYYDFTNGDNASETRDTIVDLSGNGNDAKAKNFAWNEEGSGYKDGALQFDGTDDCVELLTPRKFRTVFIVANWEMYKRMVYAQRDMSVSPVEQNNAVYAQIGRVVVYRARNVDGITYVNGKKNTSLIADNLINRKHCITEIFINTGTNNCTGTIIGASNGNVNNMKMSLYKFLAFEEELTEEQIQYVIKKYNLLDGVDEIEVS